MIHRFLHDSRLLYLLHSRRHLFVRCLTLVYVRRGRANKGTAALLTRKRINLLPALRHPEVVD